MSIEETYLALAWLAYAALHSVLASLALKQWVSTHRPRWMPAYRLSFNLIAGITLIPIALLFFAARGETLWAWTGIGFWIANGLAMAAMVGFVLSMKAYDGSEFLGLRQLREREKRVEDQENLRISDFHRYVRHPWYFLGLVLIWTRDMDVAMLISAIAITAYFAIGSRMEERKLVSYYGEAYARYRQRVAGLVPLPGKTLSESEARELENRANT